MTKQKCPFSLWNSHADFTWNSCANLVKLDRNCASLVDSFDTTNLKIYLLLLQVAVGMKLYRLDD